MLIREGNRIADLDGFLQIAGLVGTQQSQIAVQCCVRGVDIAEDLGHIGIAQALIVRDVELRFQLFTLVAIKDAERNADIEPVRWSLLASMACPGCTRAAFPARIRQSLSLLHVSLHRL
jgi:hypothetical protein